MRNLLQLCCFLLLCFQTDGLNALQREFQFSNNPDNWIQGVPLDVTCLSGKPVVLFFFEENSKLAKDLWPSLNRLAREHRDAPIVFLAVNSGSSTFAMEQYVKANQVQWPVYVDTDRSFEKQLSVETIDETHVWHGIIWMPDDTREMCRPNDLEGPVKHAIQNADWTVASNRIPESLTRVWLGYEFGRYAEIGEELKSRIRSPKEKVQKAAKEIGLKIIEAREQQLNFAKLRADTSKWLAYKELCWIREKFGTLSPNPLESEIKKLERHQEVKNQLAAYKVLDNALAALQSNTVSSMKRGRKLLRMLEEDYPESEAFQVGTQQVERIKGLLKQASFLNK